MRPTRLAAFVALAAASVFAEDASKFEPETPMNRHKSRIFVAFRDQLFPDRDAFGKFCAKHEGTPRGEARAAVIADLKARAKASMEAWTKAPVEGIRVERACWLVNGFVGEAADPRSIGEVAKREDVLYVWRVAGGEGGAGMGGAEAVPGEVYGETNADGTVKAREEKAFDAKGLVVAKSLALVNAPGAWKEGATGKGVTVAVFDGGVYPASPDLRDAMWVNADEIPGNGKDDDANGLVDDVFGANFDTGNGDIVARENPAMSRTLGGKTSHGHMCAGMIASRGKTGTLTGIAPRARIMAVVGSTDLWIEGLEYVLENGGDIVSMSFMSPQSAEFRALWRMQAEHATAAGLLLCGGAGNNGLTGKPVQIFIPKDIPCVMAGAGVDLDRKRAPFSSKGPVTWDDVPFFKDYPKSAPLRKPDVCACATGFLGIMFEGPPKEGSQGNSFSGPQIAGCAALMMEANPAIRPWQIHRLINETATDLGAKGWDAEFGWGLMNVHAAVAAAKKLSSGK